MFRVEASNGLLGLQPYNGSAPVVVCLVCNKSKLIQSVFVTGSSSHGSIRTRKCHPNYG